jgi:hypothetical protein
MVGRLDDWLKAVADKESITTDPGYFEWAGVAVFNLKKPILPFKNVVTGSGSFLRPSAITCIGASLSAVML